MKRGEMRVRVGTYVGADGKEKGRYITVGTVHEEHGELFGSLNSFIDLGTLYQLQNADSHTRGRQRRDDIGFTVYANAAPGANSAPTNKIVPGAEDVPF